MFRVIRKASNYYSHDFIESFSADQKEQNQFYQTKILDSSIEQYKTKLNEIVFQLKQGYCIYNRFCSQLSQIKKWVNNYYQFLGLHIYLQKYEGFSNLKKIIMSPKIHQQFSLIEQVLLE